MGLHHQPCRYLVREERLELSQVTLLEPKSSASTNSATLAKSCIQQLGRLKKSDIIASQEGENYPCMAKIVKPIFAC